MSENCRTIGKLQTARNEFLKMGSFVALAFSRVQMGRWKRR